MIRGLISWSVSNPLIVILLAFALAAFGGYAFFAVNVEAYPDPAPAIIEVVAQYPGASAEEVERLVTTPLEVALAGMPGLKLTRTKSLFGLSYVNNQFEYGVDYRAAKQEVLNRLTQAKLPQGVTPQISPSSPLGEIYRYALIGPPGVSDDPLYTLNDFNAVQAWTLEREFLRVPGIGGVVSYGGTCKRYEVQPDPDLLLKYGITLPVLQNAIAGSNANVGGGYLKQGDAVKVVRALGLIGKGQDPVQHVLGMKNPYTAAARLRAEEAERCEEIRQIVLASTNNVPVRVEHVIDGGPRPSHRAADKGVVVGHQPRLGHVMLSRPVKDADGKERLDADGYRSWQDHDDIVEGVVITRKGAPSLPALEAVKEKVRELNENSGRLPPGVKIEPYYDRTRLIDLTTETVRENLVMGMVLVTVILLMFLSNVRAALIVAINVPLALVFAFAILYIRGKSANLLSIGAVDFGIIVDSSVIIVENIYRNLGTEQAVELPLRERITLAAAEVQRSLLFSTLIMVCALLPLLTMSGPEGQIFGPMADTYAFALGGALLLALTLSPVLCLLAFRRVRAARDNFLVRGLKAVYLRQLAWCLNHRPMTLILAGGAIAATMAVAPFLGREFMPELEEGNIWVRGTYPVNVSLEETVARSKIARQIMKKYPEIELVYCQMGRPEGGTDPVGFNNSEFLLPLKQGEWPIAPGRTRPRTKAELIDEMNEELSHHLPGVDWNFSQPIRDNVLEVLSGVQGENCIKVFGPNLVELERVATEARNRLAKVPGIENPAVLRILGQPNLELPVDRQKCARWNVSVADVENAVETALAGRACTQMIEGEKSFDLSLYWPARLRDNQEHILNLSIDVLGHTVTPGSTLTAPATPVSGASTGTSATGTSATLPSLGGSQSNPGSVVNAPRRRLRDLITPPAGGHGDDDYTRPGAATIFREQGNRMVAIKFAVRGRDLASAVAEAQQKTADLFVSPYRAEWSGEFKEMEQAERRLMLVVSLSLALILVLLYLAFHSMLDALVVFSNVAAVSVGGIWALILTGMNFNISAAVGFISILGVAILNGLLMVSSFNALRVQGLAVREAVMEGVGRLVRPVTMTALAAIFGLLPAALSTRIGSQSQRPLAIVIVGGMLATLVMANLVPVLYSLYGHREPVEGATGMTH